MNDDRTGVDLLRTQVARVAAELPRAALPTELNDASSPVRIADARIDALLAQRMERPQRKRATLFAAASVVLHMVFFTISFPEFETMTEDVTQNRRVMVVRKYVPPPPPRMQQKQVQRRLTKKLPVPDPTPDEPEPIIEPEAEDDPIVFDDDVEMVIGDPEPPPATGPLMPGIGGVTEPELIVETKLEPVYPDMARRARIEGKVILQAVISKTGEVSDLTIMREPAADLGFSEAAIEAVQQWRYRPATQNGRPVDVFITVVVHFSLD